jgi:hypothetical protein
VRASTLGIFVLATAAGYVGARRLLQGEFADAAPERLRAPLLSARSRLRRLRDETVEALAAADQRRGEAERELYADYFSRTGRRGPRAQSGMSSDRVERL